MAIQLFIPYILLQTNGTKVPMQAPLVDSLPITPTTHSNVILTGLVGAFAAGAYQWNSVTGRWVFLVDYTTICSQLFGISSAFLWIPTVGSTFIPVGATGSALIKVTRNGAPVTNYTVGSSGITLGNPSAANDMFLTVLVSPIVPSTVLSGGVADAPMDNTMYVRGNATWAHMQDWLDEGTF